MDIVSLIIMNKLNYNHYMYVNIYRPSVRRWYRLAKIMILI